MTVSAGQYIVKESFLNTGFGRFCSPALWTLLRRICYVDVLQLDEIIGPSLSILIGGWQPFLGLKIVHAYVECVRARHKTFVKHELMLILDNLLGLPSPGGPFPQFRHAVMLSF
jgi:hypothetical protein